MTATKDDLYHVGLTDDEVRKSRTEHGFLCGLVIFRIGQGLGCFIKQVLGLGFHHAGFHKPFYQRVVRCGKHIEHNRQQRQRDQRKQQWHYHQPCRTFAQKIVLVRHLFFLPVQAQAAAHT